jgi:hypothetical protein
VFVAVQEPQRHGYLCRVKELAGKATMHSTRSSWTIFFRISPSPDCWEDKDPLASTTPATPYGCK